MMDRFQHSFFAMHDEPLLRSIFETVPEPTIDPAMRGRAVHDNQSWKIKCHIFASIGTSK